MSTDRNLLFGVLALQADLLDPPRFAEACSAWAARKDRPLSALLTERGWLTTEDVAHVEYLLQRKLDKHHGDARAGLAAVTTDEVRHSLASVVDEEVQQSLIGITPSVPGDTGSTTAHEPEGRGRYRLTRLHAQGGIGQVWLAHDHELRRDVALKELRPERLGHPVVQARFLEEARITGQLEHPGIVPVHELVEVAGQPFYTMRMVQGRTLAEAIRDYHRKRQERQPVRLELRALLNHLVAVCNAVAYAHSRGVLHRDLKPQNVVLGDYGEVMVLDWGLAKLLGQTTAEPSSLLPVTLEPGSRDETVQGQVLGTPGYMAPEQAEGRHDLLSPATDVYGLGAILYQILTGQVPFSGANDEVLARIVREEPARPRQVVSRVPRALEAVCLKALAKKPADRYASAGELAKEIEHWLADEPVTAWREPWRVKAGRWVRRHQSLVASLTVGLLTVLLLGGIGTSWVMREQGLQRASAESALGHVIDLQKQKRWPEARATLDQAEARLGESGPADLRRRITQARDNLALVVRLEDIRLHRGDWREGRIDRVEAERQYAEAFADAGLGRVGDDEAETAERIARREVRESLVAALDAWADITKDMTHRAWLLSVARQADPHPWRDQLRDPQLWQDRQKLTDLVRRVPVAELTPHLAAALGNRLASSEDGEKLLRAALLNQPNDFWFNFDLAFSLTLRRQPREAASYFRAAVGLRPDNAAAWHNLGYVALRLGDWADAETCFRKAIERADAPLSRANLALSLQRQGKQDEALVAAREAVAQGPKLAGAHDALGWILFKSGHRDEAERTLRHAIALDANHASSHNSLGVVLMAQRRTEEAEPLFQRAVGLDPWQIDAQTNLGYLLFLRGETAEGEQRLRTAVQMAPTHADANSNYGWMLFRQGKRVEADGFLRKAILIDPSHADALNTLGWILHLDNKLREAERLLRDAIKLAPRHAEAHNSLAVVRMKQGDRDEAISLLTRAIDLNPTLATSHSYLGWLLFHRGATASGIGHIRRSLALNPNDADACNNLGYALADQGQAAEVAGLFRKAIALDPDHRFVHDNYVNFLDREDRLEEGVQFYRQAIVLDSRSASLVRYLGVLLFRQGKPGEAVGMFEKALAIDSTIVAVQQVLPLARRMAALEKRLPGFLAGSLFPRSNEEGFALGSLCQSKRHYRAATGFYAAALADDAELANAGNRQHAFAGASCAALASCGKGLDADKLDPRERAGLRDQALNLLGKILTILDQHAEKAGGQVEAQLRMWRLDRDLAGVRDQAALAALPESERTAWVALWRKVDEVIRKASAK